MGNWKEEKLKLYCVYCEVDKLIVSRKQLSNDEVLVGFECGHSRKI